MKDYARDINTIVQHKYNMLGFSEPPSTIRVSLLGAGENNANYLVKIEKQKFVFRIGLRADLVKNMNREFEALKLLPPDIGPKPIYHDGARKIVPFAYTVTSFVEGKHLKIWHKKHLALHAKTLAQMHRKRYPYWGKIGQHKEKFDLERWFTDEVRKFSRDDKTILKSPVIARLLPQLKAFVKEHNHLFTGLKKFVFCNTDCCVPNILFSGDTVRYIDWEWAQFFDNAQEVGGIFNTDCSVPHGA